MRACGPAWQTAAVARDGLGLRAAPPTRPESSGKNLSYFHRIFAASRLRVSPWSRPDRPLAT